MGCGKTFFRTYETPFSPEYTMAVAGEFPLALLQHGGKFPLLLPITNDSQETADVSEDIIIPPLPLTPEQVLGLTTALYSSLRFVGDESE